MEQRIDFEGNLTCLAVLLKPNKLNWSRNLLLFYSRLNTLYIFHRCQGLPSCPFHSNLIETLYAFLISLMCATNSAHHILLKFSSFSE